MLAYLGQQTLQLITSCSRNNKEPKTENEDNTRSETARLQNSKMLKPIHAMPIAKTNAIANTGARGS